MSGLSVQTNPSSSFWISCDMLRLSIQTLNSRERDHGRGGGCGTASSILTEKARLKRYPIRSSWHFGTLALTFANHLFDRTPSSKENARHCQRRRKAAELSVVVARLMLDCAPDIAPQHRQPGQNIWLLGESINCVCKHIDGGCSHEILSEAVTHLAGHPTFVAGALWSKVSKPKFGHVPTARAPTVHAAPVAIDSIPHDFAHKAAKLLELLAPIELGSSQRRLVTVSFAENSPSQWMYDLPLQVAISGSASMRSINSSK